MTQQEFFGAEVESRKPKPSGSHQSYMKQGFLLEGAGSPFARTPGLLSRCEWANTQTELRVLFSPQGKGGSVIASVKVNPVDTWEANYVRLGRALFKRFLQYARLGNPDTYRRVEPPKKERKHGPER